MNWDEIADAYLALAEDRDKILLPSLLRIVTETRAERIADVGGGDGRFLELLARHFGPQRFSALALSDPSASMRKRAAERLASTGPVAMFAAQTELEQESWDLVLLIAVWMGLETESECVTLLRSVRSLLTPRGRLVAAVTHPCFRDRAFHTYSTNFETKDYFASGHRFRVSLYDSVRSLAIWDTHWTLSDHARQLSEAGLVIDTLIELPDVEPESEGAAWLIIVARRSDI